MESIDKTNTFLSLIADVDFSAERLLALFRAEVSDEEAVFINTFGDMNLYDRQELLLHFIMVLSHHLDDLQIEIDTVVPIVAEVAQTVFPE